MPRPASLTIATRESALALWQAHHVRDRLAALYPGIEVRILGMTTEGDRRLSTSLAKIGGKGLFVKELENALEAGSADLAVHSMKDVPMDVPDGFTIAAILEREDPRDAFVSNSHAALSDLPAGACVGTSSLRRESQIRARRPDLVLEALRGNVNTRLRKLDEGQYDAIILAAAGLKRLEMAHRITAFIEPEQSLPANGQGAVGIECRLDDHELHALLAPLEHAETRIRVLTERAMNRALQGGCQVPIGAYALVQGNEVWLRGLVGSPDGARVIRDEIRGPLADGEALGEALARRLLADGADTILAEVYRA